MMPFAGNCQNLQRLKKNLPGKCQENSLKISIDCEFFIFQPKILNKSDTVTLVWSMGSKQNKNISYASLGCSPSRKK